MASAGAAGTVAVTGPIGMGHKIAVSPIAKGERVFKYGQTIGFATADIRAGDFVHTHNLAAGEFDRDYAFASEVPADPAPILGKTFQGYRRADGRVGTRNYIAVIASVNCSAYTINEIVRHFTPETLAAYPNVDGVIALTHGSGCGLRLGGEDYEILQRSMVGMARHPNVGAYMMIGLARRASGSTL